MENNKINTKPQRIQLDNAIPNDDNLDYKDVLIYATLLTYADKETFTCFPSMNTLAEKCNMSKSVIKERLEKLEQNGNLKISKAGRKNVYTLRRPPKYLKDKEEFTMNFMKDEELTGKEKALILCIQHKLEDKDTGVGSLNNFSIGKISKLMRCGYSTCEEILNSLKKKEILLNLGDFNNNNKVFKFDLDKIGQAVLFIARQVSENTDDIKYLKNKVAQLEKELTELRAGKEEGCEVVN